MTGTIGPDTAFVAAGAHALPEDPRAVTEVAATHDSPDKAAVGRRLSIGSSAGLERFEDPGLLGEGKVNVLTLEAVVERFGPRWAQRREQVHDYVNSTLERRLGLDAWFLRTSDTDYLICQPALTHFAGQAACLRCLRDVLGHFLGDVALAYHGILAVTRIAGGALEAGQMDARAVDLADEAEEPPEPPELAAQPRARTQRTQPPPRVDEWSPFIASNGRELRVSCALDPVYELKSYGRIGFRLSRRVLLTQTGEALNAQAMAALSRADLLRIDLASIARGVERLCSDADGAARQPTLIIPVSYTSLSTLQGRAQIVAAFNAAGAYVDKGIVCEVRDIEGVPQGALLAATSLIRPFVLFVVGHLDTATRQSFDRLKEGGLDALSFEWSPALGEAAFIAWGNTTIAAAKRATKSVLIYRTGSSRLAGLAGLLGASHASLGSG